MPGCFHGFSHAQRLPDSGEPCEFAFCMKLDGGLCAIRGREHEYQPALGLVTQYLKIAFDPFIPLIENPPEQAGPQGGIPKPGNAAQLQVIGEERNEKVPVMQYQTMIMLGSQGGWLLSLFELWARFMRNSLRIHPGRHAIRHEPIAAEAVHPGLVAHVVQLEVGYPSEPGVMCDPFQELSGIENQPEAGKGDIPADYVEVFSGW